MSYFKGKSAGFQTGSSYSLAVSFSLGMGSALPSSASAIGREAARAGYGSMVYVGTFTWTTRQMLLRPVSENGTMRFPVKNWSRNNSVSFRYIRFYTWPIYGNLLNLTYVTDIWSVGKKFRRYCPKASFWWVIAWWHPFLLIWSALYRI